MSVYSIKGKGWRYDFTLNGRRHTATWFKTKREAKQAEADRRKEVLQPPPKVPTDMGFLELVNRRLDHIEAYNSNHHYVDYRYRSKVWVKLWGHLQCVEITREFIQEFMLRRNRVSAYTANKELRSLRLERIH